LDWKRDRKGVGGLTRDKNWDKDESLRPGKKVLGSCTKGVYAIGNEPFWQSFGLK
jgi:hypothetical protein